MKIQGCCTFPHGQVSIYLFILSISAYLFAISASWGCYFVDVNATFSAKSNSNGELFDDYSAGFGLFSYEDGAENRDNNFNWLCYAYNDDQLDKLDGNFKTARVFAIIANALIGIAMLFFMFTCCIQFRVQFVRILGVLMLCGAVCQAVTFLVFQSNLCKDPYECTFFFGAAFAVAAIIVSTITGILSFWMPPSVEPFTSEIYGPMLEPFQPGTVTETETVMPDGTTKITRTTVNNDGSKTIEETVYDPPDDHYSQDMQSQELLSQEGFDDDYVGQ